MAKIGVQSTSYGFKVTRKKGSNSANIEFVEEYPSSLPPDAKVHKDKHGNYSCTFVYRNPIEALRERQAMREINALYTAANQKYLYDRYIREWTDLKKIAGSCFKLSYLYELTFSSSVHSNLLHKRAKVTPQKLLRIIQAKRELKRVVFDLSCFNDGNCCLYDYSLGRKTPL